MHFLETARAVLEHRRAVALSDAVRDAADRRTQVAAALARAERAIPWWDRAVFFHDTEDEAKAKALRAELEAAQAAHDAAIAARDAALAECAKACPPIDVVARLEAVIETLLASRRRTRILEDGLALAETLDTIARDAIARWAPGADLGVLLGQLADDEARAAAAAAPLPPPRRDHERAWAPMEPGELFTRAAQEIEALGTLRAAQAQLEHARLAREALVGALRDAEAQVGLWDTLMPGQSAEEQARDATGRELSGQERRVLQAIEEVHHAVVQGLARHPVIWVALACLGAAAVIRALEPRDEATLDATSGGYLVVRSAYARAVALACLHEARAACDAAFDGLPSLIAPRVGKARQPASMDRGPYRVQGSVAEEPPPPTKGATEESRRFFERLEASGLRQELTWAVAHATMLGLIGSVKKDVGARIGWLDRAVFWSDTGDEAAESALSARLAFHEGLVRQRALGALAVVERSASQHPLLDLGRSVVAAHQAASRVATAGGSSSSPRSCPVYYREPVYAAIDRATQTLCARFGTTADRPALVAAVTAHLRRAGSVPIRAPEGTPQSPADVALLLAARLQTTPFLQALDTLDRARPAASDIRQQAAAAQAAVSFWDKLNVFTDSPEEQRRDALKDQAAQAGRVVVEREAEVRALWREALRAHPPSLLVDRALDVRHAFASVHAVSERRTSTRRVGKRTVRKTYYVCVLRGLGPAQSALAAWARHVVEVLGPLPCAGDLLDEWVAGELA